MEFVDVGGAEDAQCQRDARAVGRVGQRHAADGESRVAMRQKAEVAVADLEDVVAGADVGAADEVRLVHASS